MQVFILELFLILFFVLFSSFPSHPLLYSLISYPPLSYPLPLSSPALLSLSSFLSCSPLSFSSLLSCPPLSLCLLSSPLSSIFLDYALRHPSQLLKSSYFFFFQLSRFPELMLSINDFKVKHVACVWVTSRWKIQNCSRQQEVAFVYVEGEGILVVMVVPQRVCVWR